MARALSLLPAALALTACATTGVEYTRIPVQPKDATVLQDGLAYKILKPGDGKARPVLTDHVMANYSVWKADGSFLESTCDKTKCDPATFPLDKLIPGWQEMIPMMSVGEKVDLWLTSDLAYGDPPRKPDRPAGPLVFEIELLAINPPEQPAKPGETEKK